MRQVLRDYSTEIRVDVATRLTSGILGQESFCGVGPT